MSGATGTLLWLPAILGCEQLDATDTLLMVTLADHIGPEDSCYPGIHALAKGARCSYGTARRRLKALEQRGYITRSERRRDDGSNSTYEYLLHREPLGLPPRANCAGVRASGRAGGARTQTRGGRAHPGARAEQPNVNPPLNQPPISPHLAELPAPTDSELFDEFWQAYPRKSAKGAARKAWPAALRAAGNAATIIAGAERHRDDPNRVDQYTKHPATWLRAECWGDPPLPGRNGQPVRNRDNVMTDRSQAGVIEL